MFEPIPTIVKLELRRFYIFSIVITPDIGDEDYIPDVEILGDDLQPCNGGGAIRNLENHELCRYECEARRGICGSWVYYTNDKRCVLKSTYSCCGQKTKQKRSAGVISGNFRITSQTYRRKGMFYIVV